MVGFIFYPIPNSLPNTTKATFQSSQPSPTTLKFVPLPTPLILPPPSQLVTRIVTQGGGMPCRRCLQDGQVGETMYLIPYNPFPADAKDSPYQGPGPIYVHARECGKYEGSEVPEQQRKRLLSLRAYDGEHMMVDQAVLKGEELGAKVGRMLEGQEVEYVNVHNAGPGCFAVRIERG